MVKVKSSIPKVKRTWHVNQYDTFLPGERKIFHQVQKFVPSPENKEIMDNLAEYMAKGKSFLDLITDRIVFEKDIIEGREKKSYEVVKNLLMANKFTIAEIADLVNVAEAFVKKVKKTLK